MITKEQALQNKIALQKSGVSAWFDNKCIGTFEWATGVGKSKAALDCIQAFRQQQVQSPGTTSKVLLITPSETMRDIDWPLEFDTWNVSMDDVKRICYASLAKVNLEDYDLLIYDEGHKATLPNLKKLQEVMKPRLCLTASYPKHKYGSDKERVDLMHTLFPVVSKVTTDEAVDLGLISDFEIFVLKFHLNYVDKDLMSLDKVPVPMTEMQYYKTVTKKLQWAMMKNIEGLKFRYMGKRTQTLYNLPSKERLARHCMEKLLEDDKRTIVFAGSIEQANNLCGLQVYHSGTDATYLDKFQRGEIQLLGAVRSLNEGKNLTKPDQALIVQIDSVDRNLVQRIGRIIRKRYEQLDFKARIVILVALNTADEDWYKSSIRDFATKRIREFVVNVPK